MSTSRSQGRLRWPLLALVGLLTAGGALLGACQGTPKTEVRASLEALPKNRRAAEHGLQRTPLQAGPAPAVLHLSTAPAAPAERRLPVVLIHGTPATLYCWTEVVFGVEGAAGLAETRAVHALEIPGHGFAEEGAPLTGFQDAADHIVASLEALGLERVHLVGHSYGGEFALRAALDAPDVGEGAACNFRGFSGGGLLGSKKGEKATPDSDCVAGRSSPGASRACSSRARVDIARDAGGTEYRRARYVASSLTTEERQSWLCWLCHLYIRLFRGNRAP